MKKFFKALDDLTNVNPETHFVQCLDIQWKFIGRNIVIFAYARALYALVWIICYLAKQIM